MRRTVVLVLVAALLLASAPAVADHQERANRRLEIAGAVVFGVSHGLALVAAIRLEEGELSVPLLGPLIDLHRCRDCTGSPIESGIIGGLVLDFALQATGLALLTVGLVKHRSKHHAAILPVPTSLTLRF